MRAYLLLLLTLLTVATAAAQKPRVLLAPVDVLDSKLLPDMVKKESMEAIGQAVELYIAQQFHDGGATMVKAVQADKQLKALKEGLNTKDIREIMDTLEAAAGDAIVDFVVFVQVSRWTQRDRTPGEILRAANVAGSETKVEIRLWFYGKTDRVLFCDGIKTIEATVQGNRIGTQKRGELTGNPTDVTAMINATNRRRMSYIAKAAWEVVKPHAVRAGLAK